MFLSFLSVGEFMFHYTVLVLAFVLKSGFWECSVLIFFVPLHGGRGVVVSKDKSGNWSSVVPATASLLLDANSVTIVLISFYHPSL